MLAPTWPASTQPQQTPTPHESRIASARRRVSSRVGKALSTVRPSPSHEHNKPLSPKKLVWRDGGLGPIPSSTPSACSCANRRSVTTEFPRPAPCSHARAPSPQQAQVGGSPTHVSSANGRSPYHRERPAAGPALSAVSPPRASASVAAAARSSPPAPPAAPATASSPRTVELAMNLGKTRRHQLSSLRQRVPPPIVPPR